MTERFLLESSNYDLKYEMRIADLTRVEKSKEDFFDEDEECYKYHEFLEYLYEHGAFLTRDEAEKVLNEQDQQIKKTKEVLQKHYDYAYTQRQKNLDNAIVAEAYNVLRVTVADIADELGIEIKK